MTFKNLFSNLYPAPQSRVLKNLSLIALLSMTFATALTISSPLFAKETTTAAPTTEESLQKKKPVDAPFSSTPKFTQAQLPELRPESQHLAAVKRVTARYTQSHYKKFNCDANFSKAIFNAYIESLDYNHLFFLQEDIDQFKEKNTTLCSALKKGDTTLAFSIYNLYLKRRYERYEYALTLLNEPISFETNDKMVLDRHELAYAKTTTELNALWSQRVKYDALSLKLAKKDWAQIQKTLGNRYNNAIRYLTQSKNEDVIASYLNVFSRQIDPHTDYFSPIAAEKFESEMKRSLEGIGAVLQTEDDYATIRSLVPGGPAAKSKKIGPGDRITGVAQGNKEMVDVVGWRLDDVVELIKGKKGTTVRLEILPKGKMDGNYIVTIIREKITIEDTAAKLKIVTKENKNIAVLTLPTFYLGLAKDTEKLLSSLDGKEISSVLIDLRNNGGGALSEAIMLTGLFINGPVVQVRDSNDRVLVDMDDDDNVIAYSGPLTILINRYSASASEIFAAAMQDYGRALIIGENSYGKGTVQAMQPLSKLFDLYQNNMGSIKFTIQKFYRINGGSTQQLGVKPDITLPTTIDPEDSGESSEKTALPWDSIKPSDYTPVYNLAPLFADLSKRSAARISGNIQFEFIADAYARYKKQKKEKTISLNYAERNAEREKEEAKSLAQINQSQITQGKPTFKTFDEVPKDYEAPDAYLDEAENITIDFVNALTNPVK